MTQRILTLAVIFALGASTQLSRQNAQQSTSATIRGTVTREGTSEPISDVLIRLTGARGGRGFGGRGAADVIEGSRTDKEGRFIVSGVPQGIYTVQASLEGYFGPPTAAGYPQVASRTINIGGPSEEVNLSLFKGVVISGRAIDANGRPALGSVVQALRILYRDGLPNLRADANSPVDDRGEYRLFQLPPGEYYVCLNPSGSGPRGFSTRGGLRAESGEMPQPTYFPGTTEVLQALPLKLNPGEERTGINLNLRTARTVRISGQVLTYVAIPGRAIARGEALPVAQLSLVPRDLTIPFNTAMRGFASAQLMEPDRGRFEINGVVPGKYDLYASVINANAAAGAVDEPRYFAGRTPVDVSLQDLENVSVAIGPPLSLKLHVTMNGTAIVPQGGLRFQIQPVDTAAFVPGYAANSPAAQMGVDALGNVTIPFLNEALYRLQVAFTPFQTLQGQRGATAATELLNAYVDDIRQGGTSVYDSGLQITARDLGAVEVLVKTDGGTIDGVVSDAAGVAQSGVAVVLVPPEDRRRNTGLYKTVNTNAAGRFTIRGIAPGSYKLFAWSSVPQGAYQNAEFIAKDEQRGRQVLVTPSSTTTIELTLITPTPR
jgi:hypothetical protein